MKTAIITGASGAIGSAIAMEFAKRGYHLCLGYHKNEDGIKMLESRLKELYKLHDPCFEFFSFQADLSDYHQANTMVKACIERLKQVDVLVNNAGISHYGLFTDMSEKEWDYVMNTNLKSVFNMSHHAVKHMLSQKSGAIVNISSIWALTGASMEVAYSASKAGMDGFTKALAKELAPSGIRVNSVACGVIDTEMNANFSKEEMQMLIDDIPLMRLGTPEDVAQAVYFLASEASGFMTGEVLNLTGGHYC